jgi:hypothetical protein
MSLYLLIGRFLRRHWAAYASSGLMLAGIALLIVWIPGRSATSSTAWRPDAARPGAAVELGWLCWPPAWWCISCASAGA